jgi:WD40 repeat protein
VGSVGSTINTLDYINAHDRTLICVGTDNNAIRIFDESTHRLLSSWIALHDDYTHVHPSHHRSTANPSPTPPASGTKSKSPSKFVMDWNQQLCRIYASNTDIDYISLWDVERERCLYTMDAGTSNGVYCLTSDSNGFCAAGMGDGTVRCFDTRLRDSVVAIISPSTPLNRHSPIITLKAGTNDRLLSISNMGQLRRWDIETGISAELSVPQTSQNVLAADVHSTGNVLALATSNALQFKTCFGDLLFDIKHSKFAQVSCLSFHQYRQLLAVGFNDGSLSMFTGKTNSSAV